MPNPRHLKLTLILVALVLALAIVGEARADVTAMAPADTSTVAVTSASTQSVSDPGSADSSDTAAPGSSSDPSPVAAPPPVATDPPPVATDAPPVATDPPPGSDSASAPADPVASGQLSGGDQPTTGGGPGTSTTQIVSQVQVSGCAVHCQGTNQVQVAQQQNATVQGSTPVVPTGTPTGESQAQSSSKVTQIQVGCMHDCSGTSVDTSTPGISQATLSQLLALLGSQVPSGQPPVASRSQSSVQQTSQQWQQGDGSGGDQSQMALQSSTTVQSLVSQAVDGTADAVNQTTQTIVQVQIGCLFYCTDTHQTQQASQTNTSAQVVSQGVAAATAPAVEGVDQLVWQLQIGCLAWCSDTTQEQSAEQSNQVVFETPSTPVVPPPASPVVPPPAGPGPVPGSDVPAPGSDGLPPASSGPGALSGAPDTTDPVVVVTPQPLPKVAVDAPSVTAVTVQSGDSAGPRVPQTQVGKPGSASRPMVGLAMAANPAVATTVAPAASSARHVTRLHRRAPIAGLISSGSWRVEGFRQRPPTIASARLAPSRDESNGSGTVLALVVALALGLMLVTTVRLRTR